MSIPYSRHNITNEDIKSVVTALKSGVLTGGQQLTGFETELSGYVGSKHAVGVSSGTAGLHLAVEALKTTENVGKTVLVPSLTFSATANAALYAGLKIEFVDIDPTSLLVDIKEIETKLASSPTKYAGIIAVDFAGMPLDIIKLAKLCKQYGVWLVDDAAHALGAASHYGGKMVKVGSGEFANATVFSFHPAKHITTAEGGMVTLNDINMAYNLRLLRSHSMDKTTLKSETEGWYYQIDKLGYNYRLSEIHAALGRSQLKRIQANIERRRELANRYSEEFSKINVEIPTGESVSGHAYHLYIIEVANRKKVYDTLHAKGILAQVHYVPLHMQPYYRNIVGSIRLPNTEAYYKKSLSIPMYSTLTDKEQDIVIELVKKSVR